MKRLILLLSVLIASLTVFSQGIEFRKERYAEVLNTAKEQNKLVFIDIYTSWCGPCKYMTEHIFPLAKVGEFYNSHFLNLQLDAEKSEDGKMVAKLFGVSAYPTFLFVNGNGELVYRFLGGKSEDMFIKEGEKAVDAFAAQPELKKYMKKYEEGNRDKEFLNQYFILKDKAGLDCSDVLLDYFAQVDDNQLLDSINVPRIAKIAVFDLKLANRLVDAACREAANPMKDKKRSTAVNKAVCSFLSACLQNTARADQEEFFEEVLVMKARLFKAIGGKDSATAASLGGGNIYVPSELLRLNYYSTTKKWDKFNRTFIDYMAALRKNYEETYKEKAAMREAIDAKLKAAKESGNEEEYQGAKKLRAMMFAFSSIDDYYISISMVENVERYEEIFEGEKDETYKKQVADWYIFLHQLSPSAKTAVFVADKLLALDKNEQAMEVLALGLKDGSSAAGVEEGDVKACQAKLDELKAENGIRFIEGEKWENVLKMAREQDKYIFMDCYTSWCGPCKMLAKDIFTRKDVGDFFNENFINVKYDMEKGEGKELYQHYRANIIGFPTLLLINEDGEVMHQMAGFQEADVLIAGMKAGKEGKSLFAYRDRYEAGERGLAFLKEYVAALRGAFLKDDIEQVVLEYMKTMPLEKLQEKEVWDFVGSFIKNPYSPQFDYVIFNIDRLSNRVKFDRYNVEWQLSRALDNAVDQLVDIKFDENNTPLRLVGEAGKVDSLLRLIDRGNLKRAETCRAKIKIYELELAQKWDEIYATQMVYRGIKALGYSDRYLDRTARYVAAYCPNKAVLKKYLGLMEELQKGEDENGGKLKASYYGTLAVLHAKLGNKAKAKEFKEMDEKLKAERAKEFEAFLKESK